MSGRMGRPATGSSPVVGRPDGHFRPRRGRYGGPVPTLLDKDRTVDLLATEFAAVTSLLSGLADGQWDVDTCLPGWTVHDVAAHMLGSELQLCGRPPPDADVSHLTHMRNPIARANEAWVESMRPLAPAEMAARWEAVTADRLFALAGMTQTEFDAPSWTPVGSDETYGRFMRIRHYDCFMHEHDIRFALGLPGRSDPDHLGSCLDEVATGLGYIVGRRASLADGSRAEIRLTGDPARTYRVLVDGRASVVDTFDRPATVGIELPTATFLRLTGGRLDGPSGPVDEVGLSGDTVLGRRLVDNLAFTI
jgi:uncharacterized protein (TIGR03083 family)